MEVLDTSVVNVSLPHIAGSLSSTVDEATWVLTSYIVANAIILPITGWLSNYFGRKRLLMTVVTGFTLSSVLCGLAPSLPFLIFFRVIQGITGGGLLASIRKTTAQRLDQTIAKAPVGGREQNRTTITAAMRLIKRQYNRTLFKFGKQYTLCRGKISQAKVLLCRKHCLVNMFVAHQAFAVYSLHA